jgi:acyl-coenzyme A thioesterase PaaI-like protein
MDRAGAQAFLEENFAPWILSLRPQVIGFEESGASLRIPITDQVTRLGGIVSGQTLATMADTAMVFARCALTALPDGREVALATATFAK